MQKNHVLLLKKWKNTESAQLWLLLERRKSQLPLLISPPEWEMNTCYILRAPIISGQISFIFSFHILQTDLNNYVLVKLHIRVKFYSILENVYII